MHLALLRAAMTKKKASPREQITKLRGEIDSTDSRILELLDKRAGLASAIGEEKRRLQATAKPGEQKELTFYDPEREQRIFERLVGSKSPTSARESTRRIEFPREA